MNRGYKIFIVGALILLVAGAAFLVMRPRITSERAEIVSNRDAEAPEVSLPPAPEDRVDHFSGLPPAEVALAQQARSVAERFGSFSTNVPFENLRDLYPFISNRLRSEYEQRQTAAPRSSGAQRVTVYSIGVQPREESETRRVFSVPVQRITVSSSGERREEGAIAVVFAREEERWVVDEIRWE